MKSANIGRVAALVGSLMLAFSGNAASQDNIQWRVYSPFPSDIPLMGDGAKRLEENLTRLSGGAFILEIFEPGTLASGVEYFDHVSAGLIDAAWGFSSFHSNKSPALAIFSGLPFGPRAAEYLGWMKFGGGDALRDEIYQEFGVKGFTCGLLPPEASGWFREEIKSLDQLRGLKMRSLGLGAKVLEKLGVNTQQLSGGDIVPAFELGAIDATEFSAPAIDEGFEFFQSAKHYYFPGWHAQTSLVELLVNREKYDKLSEQHKALIETACGNNVHTMLAEGEALQFGAMERMEDGGAVIHQWPKSVIDVLRATWSEVAAEEAARDPTFMEVYNSYTTFRDSHEIWRDLAYVN